MVDVTETDEAIHYTAGGGWRVAVGVAAGLVLFMLAGFFFGKRNFEEAALAQQTQPLFARVNGRPIYCIDFRTIPECVASYRDVSKRPVVLWLGNAPLHSVNQLDASKNLPIPAVS